MSIGSQKQSRNLSCSIWEPDIDPSAGTYNPEGSLLYDQVAFEWDSFSFEKNNEAGHAGFSITLMVSQPELDEWFENGLGRHVQIYDHAQKKNIAGFVNIVNVNSVFLTASRGPLIDIANQVSNIYTPQDVSVYPPINGVTTITTIAEDTDSQERYGILEAVLSGGTILDDGTTNWAEKERDSYLEENKDPSSSEKSIGVGTESNPSVTLEILGYHAFLSKYVYEDDTVGSIAASTKIQNVLGYDPNGLFSTDYSDIEAHAFLVPAQEVKNRFADTIIKETVGLGNGTNDIRMIFGIYTDRKAKYFTIPTEFEYQLSLRDPAQQIYRYPDGPLVEPWNVENGKWLFITDFLVGRVPANTELRKDPRAMFIESVSFQTPYGLSMNGIKLTDLPQLLAKVGMGLI